MFWSKAGLGGGLPPKIFLSPLKKIQLIIKLIKHLIIITHVYYLLNKNLSI